MSGELSLGEIRRGSKLEERLRASGIGASNFAQRADQFRRAAEALVSAGHEDTARAVVHFVPGRIEVLGKHTDYAGGRSLVCAVDRGFAVVAVPTEDGLLTLLNVAGGERITLDIDPNLETKPGHWSNYPRTVVRRAARDFDIDKSGRGCAMAFVSDLPPASGLSSSSAFIVATFSVLASIFELAQHPRWIENLPDVISLAEYLGTVENGRAYHSFAADGGVGTFGGSEDHTAILGSKAGGLRCYRYAPTSFEREVDLSRDWTFAIAYSGVLAEKTGGALHRYNDLAVLASEAAAVWRQSTGETSPHLSAMLDSPNYSFERFHQAVEQQAAPARRERLLQRVEQFALEDRQIIPAALDALAAGEIDRFGEVVARSQRGAEQLLGNQLESTSSLVRLAREHGAGAASAFGAGFGGSVWALIPQDQASAMIDRWRASYARACPTEAANSVFFATPPAPPATRIC